MSKGKKIETEEKVRIVRKYLKGKFRLQAGSREAGVNRCYTLLNWIGMNENYKDQTSRTELEAAQIEITRLKHQLYLAERECGLLKMELIERRNAPHR